jgi:hypothetical protein
LQEAAGKGFVGFRCKGICLRKPAEKQRIDEAIYQREVEHYGDGVTIPWEQHYAVIDEVLSATPAK